MHAPFRSRFLNERSLLNMEKVDCEHEEKTLLLKLISPITDLCVNLLPETMSPNVLCFTALICACHSFYCAIHLTSAPIFMNIMVWVLLLMWQVVGSIYMKQALRTKNCSPLGITLQRACDSLSITFVVASICLAAGIPQLKYLPTVWYIVQITQMYFLWEQLNLFENRSNKKTKWWRRWGILHGPRELLLVIEILCALRLWVLRNLDYLSYLQNVFVEYYLLFLQSIPTWISQGALDLVQQGMVEAERNLLELADSYGEKDSVEVLMKDPKLRLLLFVQGIYFISVISMLGRLIVFGSGHTRYQMIASLLYRMIPFITYRFGVFLELSLEDVIFDGLFLSIMMTDLFLAQASKREMHEWMTAMSMLSVLGFHANGRVIIVAIVVFYYVSVIYDLCMYYNLPLFTICKNVYLDGVFDLCHVGHKNHIMRALQHGNRVFVGVMSDEDVKKYKRSPIMTLEERCAEVQSLRCVYKVIPEAPCFGMTKEFIQKYNIHVVLCSAEYDNDADEYYRVPREMGLVKTLPRTEGISTSDIIKRMKARQLEEE